MNHRHRKLLQAVFSHPINSNLNMKDVEHLLQELGAEIDNKSGSRIGVTLNGHTAAFTIADHSIPKDEVAQIRKFLETCGVTAESYPV